jgi:hypothetical protein
MKGIEEKKYTHCGVAIIIVMLSSYIFFFVLSVILKPINWSIYIYLFATAGLLFSLLCLYNITITIDNTYLSFKLGIGLIKKKYKIANIKSCKPYSGAPKRIGVGSKMSFTGKILKYYIVTGFKAIELQFHDQKITVLIGTNQPDEISQYVQSLIDEYKITGI